MFSIKFATGRWPFSVNTAIDLLANFTSKRHAARCGEIGAEHADDVGGDRHGHFPGHALPPGKSAAGEFDGMKINAETGAASAAGLTSAHGKLTRQRHKSWPDS